ncbi:MAG: FkbM family methyltransferase [Methylocystis sp.]|uniref:FkbM family methyltransferase n=1 Tax=Methylocystis sp. TaxID=1911079 RepID=UPI003D0E7819
MSVSRLFELDDPIDIVDIGANAIEGPAVYEALMRQGIGRLVGFEPQAETIGDVQTAENRTILPWAVGNGDRVSFHRCAHSGWSSTLPPAGETLMVFEQYAANSRVIETLEMDTRRLDDIEQIKRVDFLKIDIQGGELAVFQNADKKLSETVFIHTEVAFIPLYENQPTFGDVDKELRDRGFIPHCFAGIKRAIIPPLVLDNDPWKTINQLLDGDIVYVRDFRKIDALSVPQLKRMAVIAHECYNSWDLAYRLAATLESRRAIKTGATAQYLEIVNALLRTRAAKN